MKDGALQTKSFAFAVRVVNLYKYLCNEKKEFVSNSHYGRARPSEFWKSVILSGA